MKTTHILGFAAVASIGLMAGAANAQTAWIEDTLSEQCSTAAREQVASGVRGSIEESVARAEASIQAPSPVMDLACLNDLMDADIDVFSETWDQASGLASIINDVTSGLKSGLSVSTLSSGVERAICDFAEEQFETLTSGLTGSMSHITSGIEMPTFSDGFGLLNVGYSTGSSSGSTSGSASSGSSDSTTTGTTSTNASSDTESQIQGIWESISGGSN